MAEKHYIFLNPEKEKRAMDIVKVKGNAPIKPESARADVTLYFRAIEENPKASDAELILYIYKGLGGAVKEFNTPQEAKKEADRLGRIRNKDRKKK